MLDILNTLILYGLLNHLGGLILYLLYWLYVLLSLEFIDLRMNKPKVLLALNSLIFDTFLIAVYWDIFSDFLLINLRNVFKLVFDGIVVSHTSFTGNLLNNLLCLVFNVRSLVWNIFNAGFALDGCLSLNQLS